MWGATIRKQKGGIKCRRDAGVGGGNRWSRDTATRVGEMLQPITLRIHSTPNTWRSGYVTSHVHFLSCCVIDWLMKKDCIFLHFTNQQYGCRKFRYPLFATIHLQGSIGQYINLRYILFLLQCNPFTLSVLYYRYKLKFMMSHKISTFTLKLHAFSIVEGVTWCDVKLCDVKLCDVMWNYVMWCEVMWCDVKLCDVMWSYVMRCEVMWCDVKLCDVMWSYVMWCEVRVICVKSFRHLMSIDPCIIIQIV